MYYELYVIIFFIIFVIYFFKIKGRGNQENSMADPLSPSLPQYASPASRTYQPSG